MVQGIASLGAKDQMTEANQAPSTSGSEDVVSSLGKAFSSLSAKEIQELKALSDQLQEMPAEQLTALAQVIEFIQRKSDQYDIAVQTLIRQGIVEAGDLPPDYVPAFFDILAGLVKDAMSKVQAPRPSDLERPAFAKGGIAQLKAAGRYGDTTVAHLSPKSAATLKRIGGSGTINPKTGLPEYFLGGIFKGIGNFLKSAAGVILPVALNFAFPGLGTIASGAIGAGLGAMINGANPGEALGAALTGGIGGALFSGIGGMMSGQGFMGGITGALPSGFPGSTNTSPYLSSFLGGKPYTPSAAADPSNYVGGSDMGKYAAAGNSMTATGNSGAGEPGIFGKTAGFIREYPLLTAAGAALAGTALGSSLSQAKGQPAMELPPGATAEQIAAARFPAGTFTAKAAPRVQLTPTFSPAYAMGGEADARGGGHMQGPGTGTSDDIPARLSDGEFVMTAKAVRGAGDGSREKGARKMYNMMHQFEKRA